MPSDVIAIPDVMQFISHAGTKDCYCMELYIFKYFLMFLADLTNREIEIQFQT